MDSFRFKHFSVTQDRTALRLGTDAVLLGAAMTLTPEMATALDVGTGCGVLSLMVAQRLSSARGRVMPFRIDAIDIDGPSLEDARANFAASPWAPSLSALQVPLQEYVPSSPIDLIFSNPPFFDNSLRNPDPRDSASRHCDFLSFRSILTFASRHLSAGGGLSMILPASAETEAVRLGASMGLRTFRVLRIRSTERKPFSRVIVEMRRSEGAADDLKVESLTLLSNGARSVEYAALTEDFYL